MKLGTEQILVKHLVGYSHQQSADESEAWLGWVFGVGVFCDQTSVTFSRLFNQVHYSSKVAEIRRLSDVLSTIEAVFFIVR